MKYVLSLILVLMCNVAFATSKEDADAEREAAEMSSNLALAEIDERNTEWGDLDSGLYDLDGNITDAQNAGMGNPDLDNANTALDNGVDKLDEADLEISKAEALIAEGNLAMTAAEIQYGAGNWLEALLLFDDAEFKFDMAQAIAEIDVVPIIQAGNVQNLLGDVIVSDWWESQEEEE